MARKKVSSQSIQSIGGKVYWVVFKGKRKFFSMLNEAKKFARVNKGTKVYTGYKPSMKEDAKVIEIWEP